jgi:tetratricopeptide (TPR) repeat protein
MLSCPYPESINSNISPMKVNFKIIPNKVKGIIAMTHPLEYASLLIQAEEYSAAHDILVQALQDGYDPIFCLGSLGHCKFSIAAYEKTGTGMLTGITRRTYLLEARDYYTAALNIDSNDARTLQGLCNVEYSLGLLLHNRNGRTANFIKYFDALKYTSPEQAKLFESGKEIIERWFS